MTINELIEILKGHQAAGGGEATVFVGVSHKFNIKTESVSDGSGNKTVLSITFSGQELRRK